MPHAVRNENRLSPVSAAFVKNRDFLAKFLRRYFARQQDIEDVVQETYLRMQPVNTSFPKRLAAAVASLFVASTAVGQTETGDRGSEEMASLPSLEEVVVTARKREENLLEVPVSISVFSSNLIDEAGIVEPRDFSNFLRKFTKRGCVRESNQQHFGSHDVFVRGQIPDRRHGQSKYDHQ